MLRLWFAATLLVCLPLWAGEINDDFAGAANSAPDAARWAVAKTAGPGFVKLDGNGNLTANCGVPNTSHRALVLSKESVNPFAAPVRVQLKELAIGGEPGEGHNAIYVIVGRSRNGADHEFYPDGTEVGHGVCVMARKSAAGNYDVQINEFSEKKSRDGVRSEKIFELSGALTELTIDVDGTAHSMTVTVGGTTFKADGKATITEKLSGDFSAASLTVKDTLICRVAAGAVNWGLVTSPSQLRVGAISVDKP